MADDQQDEPSGLVEMARGIYKGANDLANKIPMFGVKAQDSPPPPDDTHKRLLDEANKSFIHPAQTAAQKKSVPPPATGKTMIKTAQRKR